MRHRLSLFTIALMTATTVVMGAVILSHIPGAQAQEIIAQELITPEQRALQVYDTLPTLPKENQYRHRKRRENLTDNTLISRLIRYHVSKGRSPKYRLDWKITLADYLGLNEVIVSATYPGAQFLKPNPSESDIAQIRSLSTAERDQLIQVLVDLYDPPVVSETPAPSPAPKSPELPSVPSGKASDLLAPPPQIAPESERPNNSTDSTVQFSF